MLALVNARTLVGGAFVDDAAVLIEGTRIAASAGTAPSSAI